MIRTVICCCCLAVAFGGCGRKTQEMAVEKMIEKQTGGKADVDIAKGRMNIKTEYGEMSVTTGEGAKVPADFPEDVYLYSPGEVQMAMEVPNGHSVSLLTKHEAGKVKEICRKKMIAEGWEQKAAMDLGGQYMLSYAKGERMASLAIVSEERGCMVTVTVVESE